MCSVIDREAIYCRTIGIDRAITVYGSANNTEFETFESPAKEAMFYLENQYLICLIDINYNERSHGEEYIYI